MSTINRTLRVDADGFVWVSACQDCGALVTASVDHVCAARVVETTKADYTELQVDNGWFTRPLTIVVNDRHGTHYLLDGIKDDTRVSLSSLDDVDKAAIRVLLRQALREIDLPPASGASIARRLQRHPNITRGLPTDDGPIYLSGGPITMSGGTFTAKTERDLG